GSLILRPSRPGSSLPRKALARHSREGGNPAPLLLIFALAPPLAFLLASREMRSKQSFHSPTASGSLFFACTKKSNQKKCTPGIALFGLLPEKYAASTCVPPIAHPCASGGIGAIHRAAPAGIAAAAAAMQWGPNSSALLRAEAKSERQKAKGKRQKAKSERRATVQADAVLGRAGCASLP